MESGLDLGTEMRTHTVLLPLRVQSSTRLLLVQILLTVWKFPRVLLCCVVLLR